MSPRVGKALFMVWGWLVIPWVLASLMVAFSVHWGLGLGLVGLLGLWFLDMGETTCSRCSSYGTGQCGVQSWLVPLFWARRSLRSASRRRVQLHFYFDLLMMAVGVGVFSFVPLALPVFILWLVLGWSVVFGPKKYHGLLPWLRATSEQQRGARFSLPVLPSATGTPTAQGQQMAQPTPVPSGWGSGPQQTHGQCMSASEPNVARPARKIVDAPAYFPYPYFPHFSLHADHNAAWRSGDVAA